MPTGTATGNAVIKQSKKTYGAVLAAVTAVCVGEAVAVINAMGGMACVALGVLTAITSAAVITVEQALSAMILMNAAIAGNNQKKSVLRKILAKLT